MEAIRRQSEKKTKEINMVRPLLLFCYMGKQGFKISSSWKNKIISLNHNILFFFFDGKAKRYFIHNC